MGGVGGRWEIRYVRSLQRTAVGERIMGMLNCDETRGASYPVARGADECFNVMLPTISFTALAALGRRTGEMQSRRERLLLEREKKKGERSAFHPMGGGGVIVGCYNACNTSPGKARWVFMGGRQKYSNTCAAPCTPARFR